MTLPRPATSSGVRRYERVSFSVELTVFDLTGGPPCKGRSINLSRGGMGLFVERFFPVGRQVSIHVFLNDARGKRVTVPLPATVRWAQAETAGAILGTEFDAPLTPGVEPLLCKYLDGR